MFADADLSRDAFLGGRLQLWQPVQGYRAATDPVLLAAACPAQSGDSVLDLGCGAGAAALCLASRVPGLILTGLELQPAYAALARRNAADNAIPIDIIEADLASTTLKTAFDHVIANPPYYPRSATPSPTQNRDTALRSDTPLADWIAVAARRLKPSGSLTLILAAECLPEALSALPPKLGSAVVLPLAARDGRPALRIVLRARKGGRAAFRLLAPLILHHGPAHDGDREAYTQKARDILRNAAALSAEFS